jgi:hypothetical protein
MLAFGLVPSPPPPWCRNGARADPSLLSLTPQGIYGALGVDSLEDHHKPTRVVTRNHISYIAAGYNQSFAIDNNGKTYSFGSNGPWLGHTNLSKSYLWLSRGRSPQISCLFYCGLLTISCCT